MFLSEHESKTPTTYAWQIYFQGASIGCIYPGNNSGAYIQYRKSEKTDSTKNRSKLETVKT